MARLRAAHSWALQSRKAQITRQQINRFLNLSAQGFTLIELPVVLLLIGGGLVILMASVQATQFNIGSQ